MFTESQLTTIREMVAQERTIEEIAVAMKCHRTTLQSRLYRNHDIWLDVKRSTILIAGDDYRSRLEAAGRPMPVLATR